MMNRLVKVIDTTNIKNLSIAEDSIDTVRFTLAKAYEGTDLSAGTVYSLWSIPGGQGGHDRACHLSRWGQPAH